MRNWLIGLAAATGLLAPAAEARRTVVDFNPDGSSNYRTVGGYCDYDGAECSPTTLPYTVDFRNEAFTPTNSVLNYGDGALLFSDYGLNAEPSADYYYAPLITGGVDSVAYRDALSNFAYEQSTTLWVSFDGVIEMTAFACYSTTSCSSLRYILTLVPTTAGFDASVTYFDNATYRYGYSVPGGQREFREVKNAIGQTYQFFIPASIAGLPEPPPEPPVMPVPEPATWAMMIAGFALTGMAMRRRRGYVATAG